MRAGKRNLLMGSVFFAIMGILPLVTTNPYYLRLAGTVIIYAMLALGLNVVTGFAGMLDLGYAAFFGIGGYTYALLNSYQFGLHLPFYLSLPLSALAGLTVSLLMGIPSLRLKGDYLAIVTLAFGQIFRLLVQNLDRPVNITGGPNGIVGIDTPAGLGFNTFPLGLRIYIMLAICGIAVVATSRLASSKYGRGWMAMRDDAKAASCMGVSIPAYRLLAFTYGATLAAIAGACFASWQGAIFPTNFGMHELVTILCMMALGGSGSVAGAVIGAVILVILPEFLRGYDEYRALIYGILLVGLMRFRPEGILPRTKPAKIEGSDDTGFTVPSITGGHLSVEDISIAFGGVKALDGVSFEVAPGEILGIIGPNGAGKSTLMNVISGFCRPSAGSIRLNGRELTRLPAHKVAGAGVARTFQNIRLFKDMTMEENVLVGHHLRIPSDPLTTALGLRKSRRAERNAREHVREVLAFMGYGLSQRRNQAVTGLTYGDARRVELARALISNPRILLLDEPAAGMTHEEIRELTEQIKRLNESGFTILLVEHHMEIITAVCHRVLVLDHGQELAFGKPGEVLAHEDVIRAYLGAPGAKVAKAASHAREPILELSGVRASYGAEDVLKGVNLTVGRGEIVSLVGSNAAGKTSTLKAILGELKVKEGTIRFNGKMMEGLSTPDIVGLGIGVVPEGRRIFGRLTVMENLEIGAYRNNGHPKTAMGDIFKLFPILDERRNQKAGTLSGGEQQMLAMARALVASPTLICLDEPTMGLAPVMAQRVMEAIRSMNNGGTSILLVEQNAAAAAAIAHRLYVLNSGIAQEVSQETMEEDDFAAQLAEAYF